MSNSVTSGWRRYNIFISSTFKDMDYERDVIKFRVIPALNRRFRDRRVELQAIDLRLGVNTSDMTEEESERKVLSVCTSCINSARPFFIGLIGERYGWIPPLERWKEFMNVLSDEDKHILSETAGCSVTEMEIVYGALSQESFDSSHVLFYMRDESSYLGMPQEMLPAFRDQDPELKKKLANLKSRIEILFSRHGGKDDRCTPYHISWENNHFCSDEFESIVTEQLARQIELETAREDEEGTVSWWVKEKELEESTLLRLLTGSVEFDLIDAEEKEEENEDEDDESSDILIWYIPGFGASTHMAQEYRDWDVSENSIRLLAVFGLSEYSNSMRPVIARWIHELAQVCGEDNLPDDEKLLGKMPEPELYDLFAGLVETARIQGKYIYIFMDDVEALEMTAPKDLYMHWLDRIKDDVNIQINLQGDSEAMKKFLEAHSYLTMKMPPLLDQTDAEDLISTYEKTYFLELPSQIRQQMLDATDGNKYLAPIKVHNVFRLFQSLSQEDFASIRSKEGSQIDAINSYLENIWEDMPDSPYDLMTFMVNNILQNLGLGENWINAIWTLSAAPSGLREQDIAYFAGDEWSAVQFYRAMNFLQDFFYEDPGNHLWRAKYITLPEDGLQKRQSKISEYILTLDKSDSLRETMGIYYALKSGNPLHFESYMTDDYLHKVMIADQMHFKGPQVRQLAREKYLESKEFRKYCLALPPSQRLQLMIQIRVAIADLMEQGNALSTQMSDWVNDIDVEPLSGEDLFAYASFLCNDKSSVKDLEKALSVARRSYALGYPDAKKMMMAISGRLVSFYTKNGRRANAESLTKEMAAMDLTTAKERFVSIQPLLAQAGAKGLLVNKKKARESLERYIKEYYAILDSMEPTNENLYACFNYSLQIINVFEILVSNKEYERTLKEIIRYMPTMELFYNLDSRFFDKPATLQLFVLYHFYFWITTISLFGIDNNADFEEMLKSENPVHKMYVYISFGLFQGLSRLRDLDPDNSIIDIVRTRIYAMPPWQVIMENLGLKNTGLDKIDKLIMEQYKLYASKKN